MLNSSSGGNHEKNFSFRLNLKIVMERVGGIGSEGTGRRERVGGIGSEGTGRRDRGGTINVFIVNLFCLFVKNRPIVPDATLDQVDPLVISI